MINRVKIDNILYEKNKGGLILGEDYSRESHLKFILSEEDLKKLKGIVTIK